LLNVPALIKQKRDLAAPSSKNHQSKRRKVTIRNWASPVAFLRANQPESTRQAGNQHNILCCLDPEKHSPVLSHRCRLYCNRRWHPPNTRSHQVSTTGSFVGAPRKKLTRYVTSGPVAAGGQAPPDMLTSPGR